MKLFCTRNQGLHPLWSRKVSVLWHRVISEAKFGLKEEYWKASTFCKISHYESIQFHRNQLQVFQPKKKKNCKFYILAFGQPLNNWILYIAAWLGLAQTGKFPPAGARIRKAGHPEFHQPPHDKWQQRRRKSSSPNVVTADYQII